MTEPVGRDLPANVLDPLVCHCFGITYGVIREAVRENHFKGIEQVTQYCQAGGGCRGCMGDIREIIDLTRHEFGLDKIEREKWKKKETRSNIPVIKRIRLIEDCLKKEVRVLLDGAGVDVKLIHIDGDEVELKLMGNEPCDELYGRWLGEIQSLLRKNVDEWIVAVRVKT